MIEENGIIRASGAFAFPTLDINISLLKAIHERMVVPGNQYGFGKKINPDADSADVSGNLVDCSGYVRYLLKRSTRGKFDIGDGSWVQHGTIRNLGFKKSSVAAANLKDGAVRIAFLPQGALGEGTAGHVALILDDMTMESHSGTGPDSRPWEPSKRWMSLCSVYVLTPPTNKED